MLSRSMICWAFTLSIEKLFHTNVNNRQHVFDKLRRCFFDELCFSSLKVNRLDLFNHYKTCQRRRIRHRQMKRNSAVCICHRANNRQARRLVKKKVADNQRRSSSFLFVTGLRVKGKRNKVAFFGNVSRHLPFFLANRLAKIFFARLIIGGHPRNHFG